MPTLVLETVVDAPAETVFDLARDVEVHTETMGGGEEAVAGTTSGLLEEGDVITWRARHFGVPLELTVEMAAVDEPRYFRDEQVDGPFAELVHEHRFEPVADGRESVADGDDWSGDGDERTLMTDEFRFASPLGPLGTLVDRLVLVRYLRRLLVSRNRELSRIAERRGD